MDQARKMDIGFGMLLVPPIPSMGMVITASSNSLVNGFGTARAFDIVLAFPIPAIGLTMTYSPNFNTNGLGNVRKMDMFVGAFTGMIITGSSNYHTN